MNLFDFFNLCKTFAVAGESAQLFQHLDPTFAKSPIYLMLGLGGEVGYLVIMFMMLGTEFARVAYFLIGMTLIRKFMLTLVPAWDIIDSFICIVVVMKCALYVK